MAILDLRIKGLQMNPKFTSLLPTSYFERFANSVTGIVTALAFGKSGLRCREIFSNCQNLH